MNEVLQYANEKNIAIGSFNTPTLENLMAVLEASEEKNVPVIIMHDELQFSFKSGYSGHFEMEIRMGGKYLTSVDGDICMKENTLEW